MSIFNKCFDFIGKWIGWFYNSKFWEICKVNAIWGSLIILIGMLCSSETTIAFGIAMCFWLLLSIALTGIFVICVYCAMGFYALLSYTERVLFDNNRLFIN